MKNKSKGFTLVELIIVIAIIGILAGIGYPMYGNAVKTGNRADAIDALLATAGRLEEYYMNNDTYGVSNVATLMGTDQSPESKFTLSFDSAPTAYYYKLVATANYPDTECATLTLDSLGKKGSTPAGNTCW